MRKTITALAFATFFAACNNSPKTTDTVSIPVVDSSAYRDSVTKDQNRVMNMNGVSDTLVTANGQYVKVKPDSAAATPKAIVHTKPAVHHHNRTRTTTTASPAASTDQTVAGSSDAGTTTETSTTTTTTTPKKKGWSSAAKGAVIGAGTGAVAGAIISKKKGVGAVVGGLIGAGGGYIIGKSKDKKKAKEQP